MTASKKLLNFFIVGGIGWQRLICVDDPSKFLNDAKFQARVAYDEVGGVGFNTAFDILESAEYENQPVKITLCGEVGPRSLQNTYRPLVTNWMVANGINKKIKILDTQLENDKFRTPLFTIIQSPKGRATPLAKETQTADFTGTRKPSAFSNFFNQHIKNNKFIKKIRRSFERSFSDISLASPKDIEQSVKVADCVVLNSRFPEASWIAVQAAKKYNVPIVFDLNPDNPAFINNPHLEEMIEASSHILCPAELQLPGMTEPNAAILAQTLSEKFNKSSFAISDGANPVHIYSEGKHYILMPPQLERAQDGMIYANGAGDARTGVVALRIAQRKTLVTAVEHGTAIATFSTRYIGAEWLKDLNNAPEPARAELVAA